MIDQIKAEFKLSEEDLKRPVILRQKGDVFYLMLNTKANAFTKDFVRAIHAQIDKVEANEGPTALVTVSLSKLFSGGLDLKYVSNLEPQDSRYFVMEFIGLLGRIATLPLPTFSLVRGGAVAGGCMFAFAHDYVYVAGRGMFSTNESQNQMPFPPGMLSVVRKRHAYAHFLRDMVVFSKQFSAEQALEGKLIDGIWSEANALKQVQALAGEMSQFGDNKVNMRKIKSQLYKDVIHDCFDKQLEPANLVGYHPMNAFPKL